MSVDNLERLLSPEFETDVLASTPRVLRLRLRRSPEVLELRRRHNEGFIPDELLREFVNQILRSYPDPDWFPHQTALAAIAVVLEERYSKFSETYLVDLARVRTTRLGIASRVARLCLEARLSRTTNEFRDFPAESDSKPDFRVLISDGCGQSSWDGVVSEDFSIHARAC